MKSFFRSYFGKALLFFMVLLSLATAVLSLAGIYVLVDQEFYFQDPLEIYEKSIRWNIIVNGGDDIESYLEYGSFGSYLDNTSLQYQYALPDGSVIGESLAYADQKSPSWENSYYYRQVSDKQVSYLGSAPYSQDYDIELRVKLDNDHASPDIYYYYFIFINLLYSLRYSIYAILAGALLIGVLSFVGLMSVSGRRAEDDELHPGYFHWVPLDVQCALTLMSVAVLCFVLSQAPYFANILNVVIMAGCLLLMAAVILLFCMRLAVAIKGKSVMKDLLIYHIFHFCLRVLVNIIRKLGNLLSTLIELIVNLPMLWHTAAFLAVTSVIELFVIFNTSWGDSGWIIIWFVEKLIVIPLILLFMYHLSKLERGGKALAEGNLAYTTDIRGMYGRVKEHGRNLNNIARGMNLAVNERLKSERMKTELITNVSHDIKTPLTSIINYADLISKENTDNEKIGEYSQILLKQSNRLKRLLEDLVEASKASTGNMEINLEQCDAAVFINQIDGEYEQKLKDAQLNLVVNIPENPIPIMADGRRMWRIFDNLMNNICKYAQAGTRVYITLEAVGEDAVITFRNTSRESLNISADELMERFVRGDSSRNTEGNGLGLSIAKSLAELQKGKMDLFIDGDLFKAILKFPMVQSE